MFKETEIEYIDNHKGDYSKVAYRGLKAIREQYDEEEKNNKDCGCSMAKRKIWMTDFYEWYESKNR
jgi:hypothetical protein